MNTIVFNNGASASVTHELVYDSATDMLSLYDINMAGVKTLLKGSISLAELLNSKFASPVDEDRFLVINGSIYSAFHISEEMQAVILSVHPTIIFNPIEDELFLKEYNYFLMNMYGWVWVWNDLDLLGNNLTSYIGHAKVGTVLYILLANDGEPQESLVLKHYAEGIEQPLVQSHMGVLTRNASSISDNALKYIKKDMTYQKKVYEITVKQGVNILSGEDTLIPSKYNRTSLQIHGV